MIDLEAQVITLLEGRLSRFPDIKVVSEAEYTPTHYPTVQVAEFDNTSYERSTDSGGEKHMTVVYEVNAFAKTKGATKQISLEVDQFFKGLGFSRLLRRPMETGDPNFYRYVARYRAVVSNDSIIYRR